jgi:hypothetical protein
MLDLDGEHVAVPGQLADLLGVLERAGDVALVLADLTSRAVDLIENSYVKAEWASSFEKHAGQLATAQNTNDGLRSHFGRINERIEKKREERKRRFGVVKAQAIV